MASATEATIRQQGSANDRVAMLPGRDKTAAQESVHFWSKICCFTSCCFGFLPCLIAPCMWSLGKEERALHNVTVGRKHLACGTFALSLIAVLFSGVLCGRILHKAAQPPRMCEYMSRSSCKTCVDFIALNVTEHHHHNKKHHLHAVDDIEQDEKLSNESFSENGQLPSSSNDIDIIREGRHHRGVGGRKHHHDHGKKEPYWPNGSQQSCVYGDGVATSHLSFSTTSTTTPRPASTTRRTLQLSTLTRTASGVESNGATESSAIADSHFLEQCHKSLLDPAKQVEDDLTCPFYGKHGDNVIQSAAEDDEDPEFHFHCRDEDDCEQICNCLGGEMRDHRLVLVVVGSLSFVFALVTLVFVSPKLYRHYSDLKLELTRAQLTNQQLHGDGSAHLRPQGVYLHNGVIMHLPGSTTPAAMHQMLTNDHQVMQNGNGVVQHHSVVMPTSVASSPSDVAQHQQHNNNDGPFLYAQPARAIYQGTSPNTVFNARPVANVPDQQIQVLTPELVPNFQGQRNSGSENSGGAMINIVNNQ